MIAVGLARTDPGYGGSEAPFHPGEDYPEMRGVFGGALEVGPRNPGYEGVRLSLRALGLDEERFGTPEWNPLGSLVARGGRIVLKPNFIRHWNPSPGGTVTSVVTHGSLLRAMADYAFLAVGPSGTVEVAEAPQQDCDFDVIRSLAGLDMVGGLYRRAGLHFEVIDLRREAVETSDGIIVRRRPLPGDPRGYRVVDLGMRSFFEGSGLDPERFRGADYDPAPTTEHHRDGRNEYLLSETVLSADLVVNLPKLKTHKKTGVTLALKNLVGINGDKNWLPHHTVGTPEDGGDEFPAGSAIDAARSRAIDLVRPLLDRGAALSVFRFLRRFETAVRGDEFVRSGNWWHNDTTWRMCADLNRCLYYSDARGLHLDREAPVRRVLTVLDAIVCGEGGGPLAPDDVPLGAVLAATDPVALDLVAVRLMGFDERRIAKIWRIMADPGPRITAVQTPEDVVVRHASASDPTIREESLDAIEPMHRFRPHAGWVGHIEGRRS